MPLSYFRSIRLFILGFASMSSKPTIALILPQWCFPLMFEEQSMAPLREVANVLGPFDTVPTGVVDMADTSIVFTGWGSPLFDAAALDRFPKLKLLAHTAGTV